MLHLRLDLETLTWHARNKLANELARDVGSHPLFFWWLCQWFRYILRTLNIDEATAKVLSLGFCIWMRHDASI